MRRRKLRVAKWKNPIKIICIIIFISFIITQIISAIKLRTINPSTTEAQIGEFGEKVIGMLPEDLAFTLFLPSEKAFLRDLRLTWNDSSNTHAILTRVLGFSAVPRWISPADLDLSKETTYDSISGFNLHISKNLDGMIVVNGVVSVDVGLKKGQLLVHVMDGVVMDAEFEQSVQPDEDEEDQQ